MTATQVTAAIEMIRDIGLAIRDLGNVPSGELYARLCGHLSIDEYTFIIDQLKDAGLITISHHLITWKG